MTQLRWFPGAVIVCRMHATVMTIAAVSLQLTVAMQRAVYSCRAISLPPILMTVFKHYCIYQNTPAAYVYVSLSFLAKIMRQQNRRPK